MSRVGTPSASAAAAAHAAPAYGARLVRDPDEAFALVARASAFGAASVFQSALWYRAWFAADAAGDGSTPLVVEIVDATTGALAALLPLRYERRGRLHAVGCADGGLADVNGPILGPAAPVDRAGALALARVLWQVLPHADLFEMPKCPTAIEGRPNPLALLPTAGRSLLASQVLDLGPSFELWHDGLERRFRKELERSWRVFSRAPDARFVFARDPSTALSLFDALERQQGERMRGIGAAFHLDEPGPHALYRRLIDDGLATGETFVSALVAGEEVVAVLMGFRRRERGLMVRISNAGGAWSACSPGRLLIHRTMRALHAEGVREVDFSIGAYAYKRRFGIRAEPMRELIVPLSPWGVPAAARAWAKRWLVERPRLEAIVRRLAGRPQRMVELDHHRDDAEVAEGRAKAA